MIAAVAVFLAGCASPAPWLEPASGGLPGTVELTSTPFFPQSDYQCGPAALATVLSASGLAIAPAELVPRTYLPGRRGSLQIELVAAARQYDRLAYALPPELEAVLAEVAAGHPVLVMQNLGLAFAPVWHFAVVIGYDRDAGQIVLRSGTTERLVTSTSRFMKSWGRAGRWAFILLPPGAIPARPDAGRYLAAAAALEATGRLDAARLAYERAAAEWRETPLPHLGIGNIAYARGDLVSAMQAYDAALARDSGNIAARHNLAEVLDRLGCRAAAQTEIARAMGDGQQSPLSGTVAATAARLGAQAAAGQEPPICASR